ncbi:hypothetical protein KIPB_000872 [Kipferlia bialata]|uniref:Uncharacterized protein n=1 Tax=Kipferlia bialata TaxID=797122 RepID=A0A9K3CPU2_9EUKA|nr:hypothetical protein KIPB_000872 [Kipferlia bialata]|eukprot:g872.t1
MAGEQGVPPAGASGSVENNGGKGSTQVETRGKSGRGQTNLREALELFDRVSQTISASTQGDIEKQFSRSRQFRTPGRVAAILKELIRSREETGVSTQEIRKKARDKMAKAMKRRVRAERDRHGEEDLSGPFDSKGLPASVVPLSQYRLPSQAHLDYDVYSMSMDRRQRDALASAAEVTDRLRRADTVAVLRGHKTLGGRSGSEPREGGIRLRHALSTITGSEDRTAKEIEVFTEAEVSAVERMQSAASIARRARTDRHTQRSEAERRNQEFASELKRRQSRHISQMISIHSAAGRIGTTPGDMALSARSAAPPPVSPLASQDRPGFRRHIHDTVQGRPVFLDREDPDAPDAVPRLDLSAVGGQGTGGGGGQDPASALRDYIDRNRTASARHSDRLCMTERRHRSYQSPRLSHSLTGVAPTPPQGSVSSRHGRKRVSLPRSTFAVSDALPPRRPGYGVECEEGYSSDTEDSDMSLSPSPTPRRPAAVGRLQLGGTTPSKASGPLSHRTPCTARVGRTHTPRGTQTQRGAMTQRGRAPPGLTPRGLTPRGGSMTERAKGETGVLATSFHLPGIDYPELLLCSPGLVSRERIAALSVDPLQNIAEGLDPNDVPQDDTEEGNPFEQSLRHLTSQSVQKATAPANRPPSRLNFCVSLHEMGSKLALDAPTTLRMREGDWSVQQDTARGRERQLARDKASRESIQVDVPSLRPMPPPQPQASSTQSSARSRAFRQTGHGVLDATHSMGWHLSKSP